MEFMELAQIHNLIILDFLKALALFHLKFIGQSSIKKTALKGRILSTSHTAPVITMIEAIVMVSMVVRERI